MRFSAEYWIPGKHIVWSYSSFLIRPPSTRYACVVANYTSLGFPKITKYFVKLQWYRIRTLMSVSNFICCLKINFYTHNNILVSGIQDLKIIADNVAMLNVKNQKIMIFVGIWTDMSRNINNFIVIYWIMTIKKLMNVLDLLHCILIQELICILFKLQFTMKQLYKCFFEEFFSFDLSFSFFFLSPIIIHVCLFPPPKCIQGLKSHKNTAVVCLQCTAAREFYSYSDENQRICVIQIEVIIFA